MHLNKRDENVKTVCRVLLNGVRKTYSYGGGEQETLNLFLQVFSSFSLKFKYVGNITTLLDNLPIKTVVTVGAFYSRLYPHTKKTATTTTVPINHFNPKYFTMSASESMNIFCLQKADDDDDTHTNTCVS